MIDILEAVILGLVQGLTEFIPVSSSGHLVIAQTFMSGASDHLLLEFINIGTLAALLVFFRKKIASITGDIFIRKKYRLARNIIITALPAGIVGFLLADLIGKADFFGSAVVVAISLAVVGIIMVVSEKIPHASVVENGEKLNKRKALAIGLAQVLALIPGVSRSGATILAGRFSGMPAAAAAEYSFLVSIPIMVGVTAKVLIVDYDYLINHLVVLSVSNAIAFVSGLFAIGFLLRYLSRRSLAVFGWYRIVLSVVIIAVILVQ